VVIPARPYKPRDYPEDSVIPSCWCDPLASAAFGGDYSG
jgi:hypothetical protein